MHCQEYFVGSSLDVQIDIEVDLFWDFVLRFGKGLVVDELDSEEGIKYHFKRESLGYLVSQCKFKPVLRIWTWRFFRNMDYSDAFGLKQFRFSFPLFDFILTDLNCCFLQLFSVLF